MEGAKRKREGRAKEDRKEITERKEEKKWGRTRNIAKFQT